MPWYDIALFRRQTFPIDCPSNQSITSCQLLIHCPLYPIHCHFKIIGSFVIDLSNRLPYFPIGCPCVPRLPIDCLAKPIDCLAFQAIAHLCVVTNRLLDSTIDCPWQIFILKFSWGVDMCPLFCLYIYETSSSLFLSCLLNWDSLSLRYIHTHIYPHIYTHTNILSLSLLLWF